MDLLSVEQQLVANPLQDIEAEVYLQLDALKLDIPPGPVAIPVGSRGIANLPRIIRSVGDWLRRQGAEPFIVPAMGSHNGATAEGQRQMLETLGVTEAAMEMPIRASMECVKIGSVATGDVWMDRYCYESAGVLVVNRVKLHTCFSGPIASGLTKMMVVGMGKVPSATTFHSSPAVQMPDMLLEMGQCLIDSGKILGGLAILEDGYDQTAELHALSADQILTEEPRLLERHRHFFPALPIDALNVLVVCEIGKNFSGTGMDTNVIGYRGVKYAEDLSRPRINIIAALSLSPMSHGNAIGIGLAEFVTQRLRNAIDEQKTFINAFTTGDMQRAKIPATLPSDKVLVEKLSERYGPERWLWIPNTLHLEHLYASVDLYDELTKNPRCTVAEPIELTFHKGRQRLFGGTH